MNTLLFTSSIIDALGWTLLHFIWQGAVIALLLAGANVLFKNRSAQLRYSVASFALFLMAIAPIITFGLMYTPDSSLPFLPKDQAPIAQSDLPPQSEQKFHVTQQSITTNAPIKSPLAKPEALPQERPSTTRLTHITVGMPFPPFAKVTLKPQSLSQNHLQSLAHSALPWVVSCWLIGVLILSIRLIGGWTQAQQLKQKASTAIDAATKQMMQNLMRQLHIKKSVQLLESAIAQSPMVIGWLKPVILMPTSALVGLTPQQIEAILAHELAHIRRYDYLINLIQATLETLLFYHPAIWWVSHRMRTEREHCCDDTAVSVCDNPITYAQALADLATQRQFPAVAATDGSLLSRISRVLNKPKPELKTGRQAGALGLILAITIGLIAYASPLMGAVDAKTAASQLRQMHLDLDYETAYHKGKEWVKEHPNSAEVFARYMQALTNYRQESHLIPTPVEVENAVTKARNWTEREPDNGWAWLALTAGLRGTGRGSNNVRNDAKLSRYKRGHMFEARNAAVKTTDLLPNNVDAYALRAQVYNDMIQKERGIEFVETHHTKFKNAAPLLVKKANALSVISGRPRTKNKAAKSDSAIATFKEVIKIDTTNTIAHYRLAGHFAKLGRRDSAYNWFKKTISISPHADGPRRAHWENILALTDRTEREKHAEIESDIAAFLKLREGYPGAYLEVHNTFGKMKYAQEQREMGDQILDKFPESMEAEIVLNQRIVEGMASDKVLSDEFLKQTEDFINRPTHYNTQFLSSGYQAYWQALQSRAAKPTELIKAGQGILEHYNGDTRTLLTIAVTLAEEARTYENGGQAQKRKQIAKDIVNKAFQELRMGITQPGPRKSQAQRDTLAAAIFASRGWISYNQAKQIADNKVTFLESTLNYAERDLKRAQLYAAGIPQHTYYLGKVYEALGQFDEAEKQYQSGLTSQSTANPNAKALKQLQAIKQERTKAETTGLAHLQKLGAQVLKAENNELWMVFDDRWQGKDKDLTHLQHLSNLRRIAFLQNVNLDKIHSKIKGLKLKEIVFDRNGKRRYQYTDDSGQTTTALNTEYQQQWIAKVKEYGGWVKTEPAGPDWVREVTGREYSQDVFEVNMAYYVPDENDPGKNRLENDQMTDGVLPYLSNFPKLRRLLLTEGQATDSGLGYVNDIKTLEGLWMWDAHKVSDLGIEQLKEMPNLTKVHCGNSLITDDALLHFGAMSQLEDLSLQGNSFTDYGLAHLTNLQNLKNLWVGIGITRITDSGLAHLHSLKNLEKLGVQGTAVTQEGVDALVAALPNLEESKVAWSGRKRPRLTAQKGAKPPTFDVTSITGNKLNLDNLKGRVTVLNFWFIGCPPCRAEIPSLNKLTKEFKNEKVTFIGLALDKKDALEKFLSESPFNYQIVAETRNVAKAYGVPGFPTHVVIDPKGIVTATSIGGSPDIDMTLRPMILAALGKSQKTSSKPMPGSASVPPGF